MSGSREEAERLRDFWRDWPQELEQEEEQERVGDCPCALVPGAFGGARRTAHAA